MGGNYRSDDCNTFGSRKFPCFSAHKGEEDKNNVFEHFVFFLVLFFLTQLFRISFGTFCYF